MRWRVKLTPFVVLTFEGITQHLRAGVKLLASGRKQTHIMYSFCNKLLKRTLDNV